MWLFSLLIFSLKKITKLTKYYFTKIVKVFPEKEYKTPL